VPYKVLVAPLAEVLTLDDPVVKQAARVIDDDENGFISALLVQARELAENHTWRAFVTTQFLLAMDAFPAPGMNVSSANWYGPAWGVAPGPLAVMRPDGATQTEIFIPRAPLQSVQSIKYYDPSGVLQTLDPAAYIVDTLSEPARIVPAVDTAWPATQNRINAVEVRFTAGYGDTSASVPEGIRQWIALMARTCYENREMVAVLNRGKVEMLPYVDGLLDPYRVRTYDVPRYW